MRRQLGQHGYVRVPDLSRKAAQASVVHSSKRGRKAAKDVLMRVKVIEHTEVHVMALIPYSSATHAGKNSRARFPSLETRMMYYVLMGSPFLLSSS